MLRLEQSPVLPARIVFQARDASTNPGAGTSAGEKVGREGPRSALCAPTIRPDRGGAARGPRLDNKDAGVQTEAADGIESLLNLFQNSSKSL